VLFVFAALPFTAYSHHHTSPTTIRYLNYNKFDRTRAIYPSDIAGAYLTPVTELFRLYLPSTQDTAMYNREYCFFIIIVTYTYLNLYNYMLCLVPMEAYRRVSFAQSKRFTKTIYRSHYIVIYIL